MPERSTAGVADAQRLIDRRGSHVHLVGIAGIGMAGLAVHLAARGLRVSGCDLATNRVSEWLVARGIPVEQGHDPAHLDREVDWVIRSAAVPELGGEIGAARERGLAVLDRGVVLPALIRGRTSVAVSGTHGKTTTSSMIAQILHRAGLNPGFCIGGEVVALGGVASVGDDRVIVVEADESDGTVALYSPDIALITNIEYDHMEHFDGEEALVRCFETFASRATRKVVYCADDPRASALGRRLANGLSYGFAEHAAIRGTDIEERPLSIAMNVSRAGAGLGRVILPVPGRHNAQNALGAIAAALELGVPFEQARAGLSAFVHARRRYEKVLDGEIVVISDYAHHPTEIRALVQTALLLRRRRMLAVFQPHRYTRTLALGPDFPAAFDGVDDLVLVPVYEASEAPIAGGTTEDLLKHFQKRGKTSARALASLDEAWNDLRSRLAAGDLLLVIGAGDVEQLAWRARAEWGVS